MKMKEFRPRRGRIQSTSWIHQWYVSQLVKKQECILVGRVPLVAVAVCRGVCPGGVFAQGVSAQGGVCQGGYLPRGCLPREGVCLGGCLPRRGVSAQKGGVCPKGGGFAQGGGCVSQQALWTEWQMLVKILPFQNHCWQVYSHFSH